MSLIRHLLLLLEEESSKLIKVLSSFSTVCYLGVVVIRVLICSLFVLLRPLELVVWICNR